MAVEEPIFSVPPIAVFPDISTAPFTSNVVVVMSTSVAAAMPSVPSETEYMYSPPMSLKPSFIPAFRKMPASALWVSVTS